MPFIERLPEWNALGIEPPDSKKDAGWDSREKPPADYFNWLFNRAFEALQELQENSLHADGSTEMTAPFRANAGFINEVRTSDPTNPEPGRQWFRSDL